MELPARLAARTEDGILPWGYRQTFSWGRAPCLERSIYYGTTFSLFRIAPFLRKARGAALHGHWMMKFWTRLRTTPLSMNAIILAFLAGRAIVDRVTGLCQEASLGRIKWAGHHQGDLLDWPYEWRDSYAGHDGVTRQCIFERRHWIGVIWAFAWGSCVYFYSAGFYHLTQKSFRPQSPLRGSCCTSMGRFDSYSERAYRTIFPHGCQAATTSGTWRKRARRQRLCNGWSKTQAAPAVKWQDHMLLLWLLRIS